MAKKEIVPTELHEALIKSQDMSLQEAHEEINTMYNRVYGGENPEDILYEYGLEPDYVFDILSFR